MASVLICDVFWIVHGSAYSSWCCSGWCCTESSFCKGFFCCHFWNSLNFSSVFFFPSGVDLHAFFSYVVEFFGLFSPGAYWWCLIPRNVSFPSGHLKFAVHETFQNDLDFLLSDYVGFFSFLISPLSLDLSYFTTRTVVFHLKSVFHYRMPFTPCCK